MLGARLGLTDGKSVGLPVGFDPTQSETAKPTLAPKKQPSAKATLAPTEYRTKVPTVSPTRSPTVLPKIAWQPKHKGMPCVDDPNYRGRLSISCAVISDKITMTHGIACTELSIISYSDEEIQEVYDKCPMACGICPTSDSQLATLDSSTDKDLPDSSIDDPRVESNTKLKASGGDNSSGSETETNKADKKVDILTTSAPTAEAATTSRPNHIDGKPYDDEITKNASEASSTAFSSRSIIGMLAIIIVSILIVLCLGCYIWRKRRSVSTTDGLVTGDIFLDHLRRQKLNASRGTGRIIVVVENPLASDEEQDLSESDAETDASE